MMLISAPISYMVCLTISGKSFFDKYYKTKNARIYKIYVLVLLHITI